MIRNHRWWRKSSIVALTFIGLTSSCQEHKSNHSQKTTSKTASKTTQNAEVNQVDKTKHDDTSIFQSNQDQPKVERFSYPQMSRCGGGLEGIYSNDELIRIESTYGYDMGYSEKNIDFKDGRITKIEYRKHDADWETYNQRFGDEERDIDPSKMTYFDTLYILKIHPKREFKIYSGKKRVQQQVSKVLIDRLLECTASMQKELATERAKR
jgi:hypothetical protein